MLSLSLLHLESPLLHDKLLSHKGATTSKKGNPPLPFLRDCKTSLNNSHPDQDRPTAHEFCAIIPGKNKLRSLHRKRIQQEEAH